MIRKIIKIDKEKCNGCGICIDACHEGAIGMKDKKAVLQRDDYCDGLGDCLPACPTNAISFEEREALAYNEEEVAKNKALPCGCAVSNVRTLKREADGLPMPIEHAVRSQLSQWPVQIKLVPVNAPYFKNAKLLISADCAAYAYSNFHQEFMRGSVTLIGCPKLDEGDYSEKLTTIIKENDIKSVTVVRMEVPCCIGIENAVKNALKNCGKLIPWRVVVMSTDGSIMDV